jgi:hypothetical protein
MVRVRQRTREGAFAQILCVLGVLVLTVSCGDGGPNDLSAGTTSPTQTSPPTSGSAPTTPIVTTADADPLAPTTVPFDPSLPPCAEDEPNLLLVPVSSQLSDVSVVHLTLQIADPGVTGRTDGGYPVLNAALAAGADCQLGFGTTQRVVVPGRAPRWDVLSVDGELPDPDAGSDLAHLTGRNMTTLVFYNCAGSDPTLDLADTLANIVGTSSLTCRSSVSIHAA